VLMFESLGYPVENSVSLLDGGMPRSEAELMIGNESVSLD
jgi:hypothetical protein